MESKYHVGTRSTLRCKLKRKQRPPAVGRYLCALTKPRGDAALESGLAAAVGRVLCAEAFTERCADVAIHYFVAGRFNVRQNCNRNTIYTTVMILCVQVLHSSVW